MTGPIACAIGFISMPEDERLRRFLAIHSRLRARFPQAERDIHGHPRIHLNCAAGTLTVDTAARAMAEASTWLNSLPGDIHPAEITTREFHWRIREIVSDFVNARSPEEISFHFSSTQALFNLAVSLRGQFVAQRNVIVTDLDHMANITPWEFVGGKWRRSEVRRARIQEPGLLDLDHLLSLVDENTALVALTLASNGIGTLVPLEQLVPAIRARAPSCLICVDAVHHALHGPIDVRKLDCDFLVFSGYKVFGPMLGVLWGRKEVLARMRPYRVETHRDMLPYKYEQGTLNNAALASLGAALQYLLWLDQELHPADCGEPMSRRQRFERVMSDIRSYEEEISRRILERLGQLDQDWFYLYGVQEPSLVSERDPTFALDIQGMEPAEMKKLFWERYGIQVADGNHYAAIFYRHYRRPSVCRASFAHYNSLEEVGTFLEAIDDFIGSGIKNGEARGAP